MNDTEPSSPSRIVIFDKQRSYVDALTLALETTGDLRVVDAPLDLEAGLRTLEDLRPDLAIVSHAALPGWTGTEVVQQVRNIDGDASRIPIMVLTAHPSPGVLRVARSYRHVSVVSKASSIETITQSLHEVLAGNTIFVGSNEDPFGLSRAELEVLERMVGGEKAGVIAADLHLSIHAIRARIRGVLAKTDSASQLEAVAKAVSSGVVAPPKANV